MLEYFKMNGKVHKISLWPNIYDVFTVNAIIVALSIKRQVIKIPS